MKTLLISDLTVSTELDSAAMTTVSGGTYLRRMPSWGGPSYRSYDRTDINVTNFSADQFVGQEQNVDVATGINVAFADHLTSNVSSNQNAFNNINFR